MNSKESLKHICNECQKYAGKIKVACPFRSIDNEYCDEYETIKKDLDRLEQLEKENQMLEERKDYFFNRMCAFKIIIDILTEELGLYLENKKFGKRIVYALMSKTLGMCLLNPTKKQYELLEEVFDYD